MSARSKTSSAARAVPQSAVLALVAQLVKALDDKKAEDLRVLSVGAQSSITDYLVLATGKANPHLRALRIELERVLDAAKAPIAGVETSEGSGWIVFDAYQVMIHLFLPEQRSNYRLEQLWRDAEEIEVAALIGPVPAPVPIVPVVKPAPTRKVARKGTKAASESSAATVTPRKASAVKQPAVKKVAAGKAVGKTPAAKKTTKPKPTAKQATGKKTAVKPATAKKRAAKSAQA